MLFRSATLTTNPDINSNYWNNITSGTPGVKISNAVSTANTSTNVGLEIVNRIDGTFNLAGPGVNTGNTAGRQGSLHGRVNIWRGCGAGGHGGAGRAAHAGCRTALHAGRPHVHGLRPAALIWKKGAAPSGKVPRGSERTSLLRYPVPDVGRALPCP